MDEITSSELQRLIREGRSSREMAHSLGCSRSTVRHWLKKYDLKVELSYGLADTELLGLPDLVAKSKSMSAVLKGLQRSNCKWNTNLIKGYIKELGLGTGHWLKYVPQKPRRTASEVLIKDSPHLRKIARDIVLREKLLPQLCAECGLGLLWNGKPLVLRLDHKNGLNDDHRLENLRFICPNCDSQSSTYCGRNIGVRKNERLL